MKMSCPFSIDLIVKIREEKVLGEDMANKKKSNLDNHCEEPECTGL